MKNHEQEIRGFITERFLFGEGSALQNDASLLEAGIIDSTGVLELISFIEEKFKIKVLDTELVPENLDTVDNICTFLDRKST